MTVKVADFEKVEQLMRQRKWLLDFAGNIDATDYARVTIRGKKGDHFSLYGDASIFVQSQRRIETIRGMCKVDCAEQIAAIEAEITGLGISLDA